MGILITYLLLIVPKMITPVYLLAILGFIVSVTVAVNSDFEENPVPPWVYKKMIPLSVALIFVASLIPNKQDIMILAGVYVGKELVQSEIGDKTLQLINQQLDNLLEKR